MKQELVRVVVEYGWCVVIGYAIAGAFWRRWMGGWVGGPRWWRILALPVLCLPYAILDPMAFAIVAPWLIVYWAPGHNWTHLGSLIARYGPVGLCYTLAQRFWPQSWRFGSLIDGPIAVAELSAGACMFGILGALLVYFSSHF